MKRVVIIGAGPAGLTAAYELKRQTNEYEVVILEETNDIGGISKTVVHNGNRMDIGGHRFFSQDKRVIKWWNKIMPIQGKKAYDDKILNRNKKFRSGGPDPENDENVMLIRDRFSRIYYKKKFFDYPITLKWETIRNMGFNMTVEAGISYIKSCFHKKKEDSLENFFINRFGEVLYSEFFEGYTEKLWGRHPSEISAAWGEQRVKGLSIISIIRDIFSKLNPLIKEKKVETSLIEEFLYPKYGPGAFWEKVATDFEKMGGKIYKNCKVTKIYKEKMDIKSVEYEQNQQRKVMTGDLFISSMPLKNLIYCMNDVPVQIQKVALGLPYRSFVTIGLLVDKLDISNETKIKTIKNRVPDCWIYVQDIGVKLGRIQIFNNWSPYLVKDNMKNVFIGLEYFCNETDEFYNISEKECVKIAMNELIKIGIISKNTKILDFHREKIEKAYPAYFDTYDRINEIEDYVNQLNNLYCVGRNGQHRYNNMDHSMITSFRTVAHILYGKYTKNDIWNVNI